MTATQLASEAKASSRMLTPDALSEDADILLEALTKNVVGQDEAIAAFVESYQIFRAGLSSPDRPLGSFLFLGPTGVGKTNLVQAIAEACFEDRRAMLRVDCAEFSHSHEVARLVGSPPGYLGHQETNPFLSNSNVLRYQTIDYPFTLLLFDEIEKANDSLWQLLLGVLDSGRLTLGTNKVADLSSCFIFLTSNIGAADIVAKLQDRMGFHGSAAGAQRDPDAAHREIADSVIWKARRTFSPEFFNRFDYKVVFRTLNSGHLTHVLDLELGRIAERVKRGGHDIELCLTARARTELLSRGFDATLGARPLKRTLERLIVFPLAKLVSSGQLGRAGQRETLHVDYNLGADGLTFTFALESKPATTAKARTAQAW